MDDRTYNINITAASTSTSETTSTQKPVADIMLVLDVSGSMKEEIVTYTYVAMNTKDGRKILDNDKPILWKLMVNIKNCIILITTENGVLTLAFLGKMQKNIVRSAKSIQHLQRKRPIRGCIEISGCCM